MALPTTIDSGSALDGYTVAAPRLADFRYSDKSRMISAVVVSDLTRFAELVAIVVLGLAIKLAYIGALESVGDVFYLAAVLGAGSATMIAFQLMRLYDVAAFRTVWWQLSRVWLGWTLVLALLATAVFFSKTGTEFSRVWLATWYLAGGVALTVGRIGLNRLVHHWARAGRLNRRAVVVGGGQEARDLIAALESEPNSDIRICGLFDDRDDQRSPAVVAGYPKLGKVVDLPGFARTTRIDMLIVTMPLAAESRLTGIVKSLLVLPVDIRLSALGSRLRFRPQAYSWVANVPFIDLADKPIADWAGVKKAIFDKAVAALALIALAPVMALVALAIKLESRGPVLFRQKRYGFNNELIEVFKFRSMYTDRCDQDASRLVTKGDPRVTRVGRFIRKTSLDELPQLLNVLKGELSLVGPRPHAVQAKAADRLYHDAVEGYFARHKVKPGVTGWAQINGWRGETDTLEKIQKRVEHDLYYIENWSVAFDVYILLRTPLALLKTDNAY